MWLSAVFRMGDKSTADVMAFIQFILCSAVLLWFLGGDSYSSVVCSAGQSVFQVASALEVSRLLWAVSPAGQREKGSCAECGLKGQNEESHHAELIEQKASNRHAVHGMRSGEGLAIRCAA